MKKTVVSCLIGMSYSFHSFAQETIYLNDTVVTASRVTESRENTLADVSVIEREEIEKSGLSSLVELLASQPGVEIESNGGFGQAATIHLRGNGSQAVVVLVDGMRMASATNGTTTFQDISPEQIERIEIVRGPASSLYGSDGIGGVVQIFTRQASDKPQLSAFLGYGSYHTLQGATHLSGKVENTAYALNVSTLNTDGFSTLKIATGQDADKDAYRNLSISGNVNTEVLSGQNLGLQFYRSQSHGDYDSNDFPAFQDTRQQSVALFSNNHFTASWLSKLRAGESMDVFSSVDNYGKNNIRTYQRQYSWQNDLSLPYGTLTLAYDRLEDHVVSSSTSYSKNRRSNNGWLSSYLLEAGPHSLHLSLRRDDNSQFGNHDTGNMAYGYKINPQWRVNGSFGTAFRAPTFNDLYWPFQDFGFGYTYKGNPNLKPESSRNKELSVIFDQGHHHISATLFHNEISNLIVSAQGVANDFPANVGSATIDGLSLAYEGWFSTYHLRVNSDFQNPKNDETGKVLTRRSRRHASVNIEKVIDKFELGAEMIATGKRYNDADNSIPLPGFALVNLTTSYPLSTDWNLQARVNNVLDKDYRLVSSAYSGAPNLPAYSTPGANLFIGLRYQPK